MQTFQNPCPWQTIPEMFTHNSQRYAKRIAVVDGDHSLSYEQLAERVTCCANALTEQGINKGDHICIWAPNSWQWIVSCLAIWQLGAVVVPVSSRLKAMEVGPVLQRSKSRLLFSVSDCAGDDLPSLLANQFGNHDDRPFDQIPKLEKLIYFDKAGKTRNSIDFSTLIDTPDKTNSPADRDLAVTGQTTSELLFTSGTTGDPKGVMLSHSQVLQAYWDWSDIGGLNEHDRFLVIPPFSHGFGINAGILACLMRGMTHVVVDFFDPTKALSLIQTHQITVMSGPPALFASIAKQNGNMPLDSLRVAYVGAAHVPKDTINCMQNSLGINRVINAYGLIEGCVVSMTRNDDTPEIISQSTGRAMPDTKLRIVDEQGAICTEGQHGEIQVQGYGVMQAYYEAPELTAATIDADGWLSTGDIGSLDQLGNLSIVGRKKEMFICNGFNVYPAEVEDLLLRHPNIAQAAVVAIAHPEKGEVGAAFIIADNPKATLDIQQISLWAKQNMAAYKVPQRIVEVSTLPLNANGKVQKDQLKIMAEHNTTSYPVE